MLLHRSEIFDPARCAQKRGGGQRPLPLDETSAIVVTDAEAAELAAGNERSFLHVVRPEIDLPEGTDEHSEAVYAAGAAALARLAASDAFVREDAPSLYVYRLVWTHYAQAVVDIDELESHAAHLS